MGTTWHWAPDGSSGDAGAREQGWFCVEDGDDGGEDSKVATVDAVRLGVRTNGETGELGTGREEGSGRAGLSEESGGEDGAARSGVTARSGGTSGRLGARGGK